MKNFIFLILTLLSINSFGQGAFSNVKENTKQSTYYFELIGGASLPSMIFKNNTFDSYGSENFLVPTEGIAFRVHYKKYFSLATQLSFRNQGVHLTDPYHSKISANYVTSFTYGEFEFSLVHDHKRVSPMMVLFAGPSFSKFAYGSISSDVIDQQLTSNEIASWDYGAEAGIGIRIPTFSANNRSNITVKASYYYGLANTFPKSTSYQTSAEMNRLLLADLGTRTNSAIRLVVVCELALKKNKTITYTAGGNGKSTYERFVLVQER